ncbi:MAG: hypothetical protein RLZZ188_2000 [Verrucomicrobiota bacterium]
MRPEAGGVIGGFNPLAQTVLARQTLCNGT